MIVEALIHLQGEALAEVLAGHHLCHAALITVLAVIVEAAAQFIVVPQLSRIGLVPHHVWRGIGHYLGAGVHQNLNLLWNQSLHEEQAIKTAKKIHNQKFAELSGNDIFKGDAAATSGEEQIHKKTKGKTACM